MKSIAWKLETMPRKILEFIENEVYIETQDGRHYVADYRIGCVTEVEFTVLHPFVRGYGFIEYENTLILLGPDGKRRESWKLALDERWIYPCAPFSDGMCRMMKSDRSFAFMNTDGQMINMPKSVMAEDFTEGYARVLTGSKHGKQIMRLIDKNGRTALKSDAHYLSGVHNGCCIELLDRGTLRLTHGFGERPLRSKEIRVRGEIHFERDWEGEALIPYRGKRLVSESDSGLICLKNGEVSPMRWRGAMMGCCGRARVESRGGVTFVDEAFEPMRMKRRKQDEQTLADLLRGQRGEVRYFKQAQNFSEDVCAVDNGHDRWSYIDLDGNPAFPGCFEMAMPMHRGVALVCSKSGWHAIDRQGRRLKQDFAWEELCTFENRGEHFMVKTPESIAFKGERRYAWYLISRDSLTEQG